MPLMRGGLRDCMYVVVIPVCHQISWYVVKTWVSACSATIRCPHQKSCNNSCNALEKVLVIINWPQPKRSCQALLKRELAKVIQVTACCRSKRKGSQFEYRQFFFMVEVANRYGRLISHAAVWNDRNHYKVTVLLKSTCSYIYVSLLCNLLVLSEWAFDQTKQQCYF